jgi:hypothetical protein
MLGTSLALSITLPEDLRQFWGLASCRTQVSRLPSHYRKTCASSVTCAMLGHKSRLPSHFRKTCASLGVNHLFALSLVSILSLRKSCLRQINLKTWRMFRHESPACHLTFLRLAPVRGLALAITFPEDLRQFKGLASVRV